MNIQIFLFVAIHLSLTVSEELYQRYDAVCKPSAVQSLRKTQEVIRFLEAFDKMLNQQPYFIATRIQFMSQY